MSWNAQAERDGRQKAEKWNFRDVDFSHGPEEGETDRRSGGLKEFLSPSTHSVILAIRPFLMFRTPRFDGREFEKPAA
jgi:hypothetical protein